MSNHSVQDGQEFAHAGGKGHLLGLASGDEAFVEGSDSRIAAGGDESSHVQHGPHLRAATPDGAPASQGATVPVQGRNADQGGDLLPIQRSQLLQLGKEGGGEYGAHTWGTLEQVVLSSPHVTRMNGLPQVFVEV